MGSCQESMRELPAVFINYLILFLFLLVILSDALRSFWEDQSAGKTVTGARKGTRVYQALDTIVCLLQVTAIT